MNYYYHSDDPRKKRPTPCCRNCRYKLNDFCGNAQSANYENNVYDDGCCTDYKEKTNADTKA